MMSSWFQRRWSDVLKAVHHSPHHQYISPAIYAQYRTVIPLMRRYLAGRVTDTLGFGPGGLESPELLDHLVQQHHDVPARQQPIERVGVFDEGRGVWDVNRPGKRVGGLLHVDLQSTIVLLIAYPLKQP